MNTIDRYQLASLYLGWLRRKMRPANSGNMFVFPMPFHLRESEWLYIYVKPLLSDYLLLTDNGNTMRHLDVSSLEHSIKSILRRFNIDLYEGKLEVRTCLHMFTQKMHCLLQAMLAVDKFLELQEKNRK
ncbi:MAG: hypothetical protein DDT19_02995 [Syntrophomonadaceae bacterium]|nr:hypothetical protein [Bacillota bacterium]